jgi:hypothetical protein
MWSLVGLGLPARGRLLSSRRCSEQQGMCCRAAGGAAVSSAGGQGRSREDLWAHSWPGMGA